MGSLAFDHFGLFGLPVHHVTFPRITGVLFLLVGAVSFAIDVNKRLSRSGTPDRERGSEQATARLGSRFDGFPGPFARMLPTLGSVPINARCPLSGRKQTSESNSGMSPFDAVDGAHSAASKCHRVVALKRTTLRGAIHGRS